MKHPSPDELKPLLNALDVATWAWAVQQNSKRKGQVNWKGAFNELCEAWESYQLAVCSLEPTLSNPQKAEGE